MDEQVAQVLQELSDLNTQVRNGEVYQSLGTRLGKIMDDIHRRRRTAVQLPDDGDDIQDILEELRSQLNDNVPVTLSRAQMTNLIDHLSSLDPGLRYQGINFSLYDALQQNALDSGQLTYLFQQLRDPEALFDHILEPANAAVFGRAGRVAMLAVLLHFISPDKVPVDPDLQPTVVLAAAYLCLETDTRGFVNHYGWAHAFTAATDLLSVLAGNQNLTRADKLFLMMTLIERIKRLNTPLIYGENDRIATFLTELANRHDLYEETLLLALKSWRQQVALHRRPDTIAGWNRFFNRKRLLDSLRLQESLPQSLKKYLNSTIDFLG
ncbi:DUF2785 domain-containing protein [Levilactobacillus lanxiensis]|uniref:DUF2785 domain-containing protein n=1 Tax=Levilactobacillus lanxiensis TaxID=2799568 RepID=A0ABW4D7Y2_9LACO|nr:MULTISPECIES: DUF2785 domain-containing protein [Levilactobacillus]